MIYPSFLKNTASVGICAPSAGIGHKEESFDQSERVLLSQGWHLIETAHVRVDDVRGGSAKERAKELGQLFADPQVDAVFAASGGDFLSEMLPFVDWDEMKQHPKWLMGASDPTGLLFPYTTLCDVATLYGSNAGSFDTLVAGEDGLPSYLCGILDFFKGEGAQQSSWKRHLGCAPFLAGDGPVQYDTPTVYHSDTEGLHTRGRCLGGCIDVLKDLIGTPFDGTKQFLSRYAQDGVIWYFDNFSLTSAVLYRTLLQLRYAGWLDPAHTRAVLIGRTLFETEESGMTYDDAIRLALPDIPVVWEADIGHTIPHFYMVNGAMLDLDWEKGQLQLNFSLC